MMTKKSNLCVSADVTTTDELLSLADEVRALLFVIFDF